VKDLFDVLVFGMALLDVVVFALAPLGPGLLVLDLTKVTALLVPCMRIVLLPCITLI